MAAIAPAPHVISLIGTLEENPDITINITAISFYPGSFFAFVSVLNSEDLSSTLYMMTGGVSVSGSVLTCVGTTIWEGKYGTLKVVADTAKSTVSWSFKPFDGSAGTSGTGTVGQ